MEVAWSRHFVCDCLISTDLLVPIITLAGIVSACGVTTSSAACNLWNTIVFLRTQDSDRCINKIPYKIRLDVSHDQERCGVDVNNNDSVWSFGHRSVRHQMTQYIFLKEHVQYKCKDLTQGVCYRRDSCRDSEGWLWFMWMFSMIPRDKIVISVKIRTYFLKSRFFLSQYHNMLLICFPICMINLR